MAIMLCLVAMLVPGLELARSHARTAVCSGNQRQLLLAMVTYDQGSGRLPLGIDLHRKDRPPGGWAGNMMKDPPGWWWFHLLSIPTPSPGARTILACPASHLTDPDLRQCPLYGQLGVNWSICRSSKPLGYFNDGFRGDPCSLDHIRRPSQSLLVVDSGYALIGWPHVTADPPIQLGDKFGYETAYLPGLAANQQRALLCSQRPDATRSRHPEGKVNAGWADGHVARSSTSQLEVVRTEQGYINTTPIWVPADR